MISVPPWLTFLVAGAVIVFGVYRLLLAKRSRAEDLRARERGGMYGMSRRRHLLFGLAYLIIGGILIAMALGIEVLPIRQLFEAPTPKTSTIIVE